ncbi:MAG TPA: alpha/beta hydrolase [Methylomirabilota bacterium]|nr:alpha/beta hydrolase [Methylomirabilota bacterium]
MTDLEGVMARRRQAAAAARAALPGRLGVPYADTPGATLDIFPAANGADPAPVHVFIHGGFWRSLDAATFSFVAAGFAPFGAATVVLDYPLIPEVRLGTIVARCQAAVGWVFRHAAEFGGDADRLFVSGNSAGGHLVALLMDRAWPPGQGLPADVLKGGCAISGVFDLEPVFLSAQNDSLGLTREEVAALSPIHRVPEAAGPLIVAVGGAETREFLDQTAEYAAACRAAGLAADVFVMPGANHLTVVLDGLADPKAELNRQVRRQMGLRPD